MKQVEVIGNATLILGDCRDALVSFKSPGTADVAITDPMWPNSPLYKRSDDLKGVWEAAWRVMPKVKRSITVLRQDSNPCFLNIVPLPFQCVMQMPCFEALDLVAYFHGREPVIPLMPKRAHGWNKTMHHPAAKALPHFMHLIQWWTDKDDTILDPFMGSGTTGEAALRQGRRFVGIEKDKTYFEMACTRLAKVSAQGSRGSAP